MSGWREDGELLRRYVALVLAYAEARDESSLQAAGDLGAALVEREVPVEDIGEMQERAVRALLERAPHMMLATAVDRVLPPLQEVLMAYGLAFREQAAARERTERRLADQRSLAQLGEMAAVVAHEVRNPLAGIGGALRTIEGSLPAEGPFREVVAEILGRLDALDQSMNELLLFARPQKPRVGVSVGLRAFAEESVAFARSDPRFAGVEMRVEGEEVQIPADPRLLKPMLLNLLLNAAQAMDGGGCITLAVDAGEDVCKLTVKDTGPGIPEDVRERLFEPFFTTKRRGSGLGLPTVRRVVEAHGGRVEVRCPAAGGTEVIVELPRG